MLSDVAQNIIGQNYKFGLNTLKKNQPKRFQARFDVEWRQPKRPQYSKSIDICHLNTQK